MTFPKFSSRIYFNDHKYFKQRSNIELQKKEAKGVIVRFELRTKPSGLNM